MPGSGVRTKVLLTRSPLSDIGLRKPDIRSFYFLFSELMNLFVLIRIDIRQ